MKLKFDKIQEILKQLNGNKILIRGNHDRHWSKTKWQRAGFDEVHDRLKYHINGISLGLAHDPNNQHLDDCDILLCGHVHNNWTTSDQYKIPRINVGVDVWGYIPVAWDTIV